MAVKKISPEDYTEALTRGHEALATPHAVSARYIVNACVLELVYNNGLTIRIDPKEVAALKDVPRHVLMQAYVSPGGDGLLFGEDDKAAVSIPGMIAQLIPIDIERRAVDAASGRVRSASKSDAARRNGAKGGRPRKAGIAATA